MAEQWKPVPEYEGIYEVSTEGHIRSLDRIIQDSRGRKYTRKGKILSQKLSKGGYLNVGLRKDGTTKHFLVHRLVLSAFIGDPPKGTETRHLNGDSVDNRIENLAWGTPTENNRDTLNHGNHVNAQKKRCKRGHLLEVPNVRRRQDRPTHRECMSCYLASKQIANRPELRDKRREIAEHFYSKTGLH